MNNWLKQQLIYQPVIRESKINIIPEQETIILPKKKIKTTSLEGYTPTLLKEPQEKVIIEIPQEETKYPKVFQNKSEFIKVMTPLYEKILASKGIDTSFAKALVQQSGLESNWGKSQSGKFNLGGIKGKGTKKRTREVINGKDQYIYDSFRDFNSLEDYANYHVNLLNNNRYKAFSGTVNEFADKVAKGGYATDPRYKNILNKMIASAKFGMKVPKYPPYDPTKFKNTIPETYNNEFIGLFEKIQNLKIEQDRLQKLINAQKTIKRSYNPENINWLYNYFISNQLPEEQVLSLISNIIHESGGEVNNPSSSGKYNGLIHWSPERYQDMLDTTIPTDSMLKRQADYLINTVKGKDTYMDWVKTKTNHKLFHSGQTPLDVNNGLISGYVRPANIEKEIRERTQTHNDLKWQLKKNEF